MKIYEALRGVNIIKSKLDLNESVGIICSDTRKAAEQGMFIAIRGTKRDGNSYIEQALSVGVRCVVTDDLDSFEKFENTVLVKNSRQALAYAWNNYYSNPACKMKLIAITGTNGKTSCAHYIYSILKRDGKRTGLISTIECLVDDEEYNTNGGAEVLDLCSAMTTPDPEILYKILDKMRKKDIEYVVMEASSHALAQYKLDPLSFEIGLFTNLSSEHMDFHQNMEHYYLSKMRLFEKCKCGIINIDNKYGKRAFEDIKCEKISCSVCESSDFYAYEKELDESGAEYLLKMGSDSIKIKTSVCSIFGIYNTMMASACGVRLGIQKDIIAEAILNTKVKGRLERIENTDVFIDYAHTPFAMENVLRGMRKSFPTKKITVLFGCGGDRDKSKRPLMGKIALELADDVIITSDNSRTEDTVSIIRDILSGISNKKSFVVIPKREAAIEYAVKNMKNDDILLLLGKGHEKYEINKAGKHYFSEREIVEKALENDNNK